MTKRVCTKCNRVLQESVYDKCMYCGEPIPEIFRLSEYKKEEIKEKTKEREKKRKVKKKDSSGHGGSCGVGGTCGGCGAG